MLLPPRPSGSLLHRPRQASGLAPTSAHRLRPPNHRPRRTSSTTAHCWVLSTAPGPATAVKECPRIHFQDHWGPL